MTTHDEGLWFDGCDFIHSKHSEKTVAHKDCLRVSHQENQTLFVKRRKDKYSVGPTRNLYGKSVRDLAGGGPPGLGLGFPPVRSNLPS